MNELGFSGWPWLDNPTSKEGYVTETEWLTFCDPRRMLDKALCARRGVFVHGKVLERKRDLLVVACCRRVGRHIRADVRRLLREVMAHCPNDPCWAGAPEFKQLGEVFGRAIDQVESRAEFHMGKGNFTRRGREDAVAALEIRLNHLQKWAWDLNRFLGTRSSEAALDWNTRAIGLCLALGAAESALPFVVEPHKVLEKCAQAVYYLKSPEACWYADQSMGYFNEDVAERKIQAQLVADIFGNPFRCLTVAPDWTARLGDVVLRLARVIYADRDFALLPILADALEEAGCTEASIVDHCRGPEPHARGCWVVDLILSKDRCSSQ